MKGQRSEGRDHVSVFLMMLKINTKPMTRLQEGQIVLVGEVRHHVILVNESRARVVPMKKVPKSYTTVMGEKVSFNASGKPFNISPDSEIPIVGFEPLTEKEEK